MRRACPATLSRTLLLLLALVVVGCSSSGRRGDDDDDSSGDDDDDSANGDDDDSNGGDDDDTSTGDPFSPVIQQIEVCQTLLVGNNYARFDLDITDPDGDLLDPITYRLRIDDAGMVPYQFPAELGFGGTLGHLERIEVGSLTAGTEHEFAFQVLDSVAHASLLESVTWTIPENSWTDPCD